MKNRRPPRPADKGRKPASPDRRPAARTEPRRDARPEPRRDARPDRAPKEAAPNNRSRKDPPRKDPRSPQDFTVEGLSALSEYLKFKPESVIGVSSSPAMKASVQKALDASGVDVKIEELAKDSLPHADSSPVRARVRIKAVDDETFFARAAARETDVVIALDHITDPRNLGAIVRSAAFFGVKEVLAPERRQVLLTQSSVATAQGGFALTDLVCVVNLSRALTELKEKGYWIIGAAMDGEPYPRLVKKYEKVVLVLGAEDTGMSQKIRENCDLVASIPGAGEGLDSLNVSVAAGILLSGFCAPG